MNKEMNPINKVQLTGNLGNNPETKTFEDGNKMVRFSLATNEEFTNRKGEKSTDTQWHFIIVKGKLAQRAESELQKGTSVSIEGRLVTRNYVDKNGQKRYVTEIVANEIVVNQKEE